MTAMRYVPAYRLELNRSAVPKAMQSAISSISCQSGLEGADRVEVSLVNDNLRWLDHPLLTLDTPLTLAMGYTDTSLEQVFVGEIVSQEASFPSSGPPTLTVAAQDYLQRLQQGTKVRWFAMPTKKFGNLPIPDYPGVVDQVSLQNGLIPVVDPIAATLAVTLGGVEAVAQAYSKSGTMQNLIRKQEGESDFDFLQRIAQQLGWDMLIDHSEPLGGYKLRFTSSLDWLDAELSLKYGRSLLDFTPRVTNVGQVAAVAVHLWQSDMKMGFTLTVGWDWDRQSLEISVSSGFGMPAGTTQESGRAQITLVDEPVTLTSAPRVLLSRLIPKLNNRLTGTGSTIGDMRIKPGVVLRLKGLGEQFSGLYRVTSATHTIDSGGFRTSFEVRKEIWFGSVPSYDRSKLPLSVQGFRLSA